MGPCFRRDDPRELLRELHRRPQLPLPLAGEGWGGGVSATAARKIKVSGATNVLNITESVLAAFPHPPSLREGTLPRKREREESRRRRCHARLDDDGLAGHEARGIGGELGEGAGDFVGLA